MDSLTEMSVSVLYRTHNSYNSTLVAQVAGVFCVTNNQQKEK